MLVWVENCWCSRGFICSCPIHVVDDAVGCYNNDDTNTRHQVKGSLSKDWPQHLCYTNIYCYYILCSPKWNLLSDFKNQILICSSPRCTLQHALRDSYKSVHKKWDVRCLYYLAGVKRWRGTTARKATTIAFEVLILQGATHWTTILYLPHNNVCSLC